MKPTRKIVLGVVGVGLPQIKTNGAWLRPHLTADDGVLTAPTILVAGGTAKVVVDAPSDGAGWRLPVFWREQGEGPHIGGIIRFNLRVLKVWWPYRHQVALPRISLRGDQEIRTAFSTAIPAAPYPQTTSREAVR